VSEDLNRRASVVHRELKKAFPNPAIPLDHKDTYTMLVAVMLSAQCTDKRVNLTTPKLFAVADTPQKMLKLGFDKVRAIIKPCGLPDMKANGLVEGARMILEEFGGEVPGTLEELTRLPAVGEKTASVVLIHAFKIPAFPVDTHIFRLAHRWGLSQAKTPSGVSKDLKKLFPKRSWEKLHLQFIYYGRAYCSARGCSGPDGDKPCPLCQKIAKM